MKKFLSYILTTTALLASCASEDFTVSEGTPSTTTTDNTITILADRQDFLCGDNTRAAYSGVSMAFENGDRIGLYAVNGTTVVSSNVCFTFNGTEWTSTTDVTYNAGYDYYAYYPYVASPYTPDFTQSGLKAKFQLFIDDASNKFHQADQSTKAAFNASDLCIAQAVHVSPHVVRFSFEHKKGLAVFNGVSAAAATFSGDNIPYATDNAKYYVMKDATATTFTDNASGTYSLYASSGKYVTHSVSAYLTFVARESGTFSFSSTGLSYSLDDGETWTALAANTNTPTVTAGNKIMWKNNTTLTPYSTVGIGKFSSTGNFDVSGNIMSLYYGDDAAGETSLSGKDYAFQYLFSNSKVVNANQLFLPATTLAERCYSNMFYNCTRLTAAPSVLPATTMQSYCYEYLFKNCESLTTAPELPATTLASNCYQYMFQGCRVLPTAPELPATTLASNCYQYMFNGCWALTTTPILPSTTLAESCYYGMFQGCKALTTVTELPATTLVDNCYTFMFFGCSSLNYVKAAFTTTPSGTYTSMWLYDVPTTGTFYKNSAAAWDVTGVNGVPSGWTVETYTP